MRNCSTFLAASGLSFGMLLAAAPAHAVVFTKPFTAPAGPYNFSRPNGTIAAIKITKPNTYNFTFTTTGTFDVLVQMQASMFRPVQPQPLVFSLFKGVPGSGVFVVSSGAAVTGPAIDQILTAGNYYVQILPANIAKNNELLTGGLTVTAVPEPASWGLMITGFGLLGLAARRRREMRLAAG